MFSGKDLQFGRLAVRQGFLRPEQLGEASALAAQAGISLALTLRQQGLLDSRQEQLVRELMGEGNTTSGVGQPSVAYLASQSPSFTPAADVDSSGEPAAVHAAPGREDGWPVPRSSKYEIWGEIATGGMGRIYLAYDRDINRKVAMKVMREHGQRNPARVKRFIEEIQATGQLEHPSIVPIYDMGMMEGGQPFFIMRYVKGRSLEAIVDELRSAGAHPAARAPGHVVSEYGRVRLLSILHQICMAVHFVHERGVIHRDLKPANVMIGSYGEVQIMDWGLAKVRGRQDPVDAATRVDLMSPMEHPATLDGQVIGTPAYMPPEQAAGHARAATAASDVYSLGAILYSLLTLEIPVVGRTTADILERVQRGDVIPPRRRAPERMIPESLEDICLHAMALRAEDRYPSARALADEITSYLEGHRERERSHAQAEEFFTEGSRLAGHYHTLKKSLQDLVERAEKARRSVQQWWPLEDRREVWDARAAVTSARQELAETYTAATEQFYRALRYEQLHVPSRSALADLYWERFQEAEASGHQSDQIMYRNLVERYHDGHYADLLRGDGKLSLSVKPLPAEVFLGRYEDDGPARELGSETYLGTTPLAGYPLAMGSYLLRLVSPRRRETVVPVRVDRAEDVSLEVTLFGESEIGEDFVHVPGGAVSLAGDPDATSPRSRFLCDRPDFFLGRYPVTVEQYQLFLKGLVQLGRREEALHRVPRESAEGGAFWDLDDEGNCAMLPSQENYHWGPRYPIACVSWRDAIAYCQWLSDRLGKVVSLPHDRDWEKAARGADGRFFPWGNEHDYTFANNAHSHETGGRLVPVGSFPMDRSPYGVMDMTGNVIELCRNSPAATYPQAAVIKGGGYSSPGLDARAAGRAMLDKHMVRRAVGFRVAIYPHGIPADEQPVEP